MRGLKGKVALVAGAAPGNIGAATSLTLSYDHWGSYSVKAFFDKIPHTWGTNAHSPYNGIGTGVLRLPPELPPGTNEPADVLATFASLKPFTLQVDRERMGLLAEHTAIRNWKFFVNYLNEDRDGTKPFSGGLFFSFDPGDPAFHYRAIPFETQRQTLETSADYQLGRYQRASLTYMREQIDRKFREVAETVEDRVRLIWSYRGWEAATLRLEGQYASRDGNGYNPDPYEEFYSSSLPGATPSSPLGFTPHALASLRKRDVADLRRTKLESRLNLMINDRTDGFLSVQYQEDEYPDSSAGLIGERVTAANAEVNFTPGASFSYYAFASWQQRKTSQATINDAGVGLGPDPNPGGPTYPLENAWSADSEDEDRTLGAGATRSLGPVDLRLNLSYVDTKTAIDYAYASLGALANPQLGASAGSAFPDLTFERAIAQLDARWPLTQQASARFYYRFEHGRVQDWHFDGLTNVVNRVMFLGLVPEDWDTHTVGVFCQWQIQ